MPLFFQGKPDLQSQVRAQAQADRQAAAPVDAANPPGHGHLPVSLDHQ